MSAGAQRQPKAANPPAAAPAAPALLQRKCACGGSPGVDGECSECRQKRLQRKARAAGRTPEVPPIVHDVLRSPGQPLDPRARAFLEPRFGHDFGRVRVHADARAAESARSVDALAYTVGPHVVFAPGRYAPATGEGRRLLAHELAHVAQQGTSAAAPEKGLAISPPDHPAERAADAASEAALGGTLPAVPTATPVQLQRQPNPLEGGPGEPNDRGSLIRRLGQPLPFVEATKLAECIKAMGEESADECREQVLGEESLTGEQKKDEGQVPISPTGTKKVSFGTGPLFGLPFRSALPPYALLFSKEEARRLAERSLPVNVKIKAPSSAAAASPKAKSEGEVSYFGLDFEGGETFDLPEKEVTSDFSLSVVWHDWHRPWLGKYVDLLKDPSVGIQVVVSGANWRAAHLIFQATMPLVNIEYKKFALSIPLSYEKGLLGENADHLKAGAKVEYNPTKRIGLFIGVDGTFRSHEHGFFIGSVSGGMILHFGKPPKAKPEH